MAYIQNIGNAKLYINGELALNSNGSIPTINTTYPIYIGKHAVLAGNYTGFLDDIMIYGRLLTENEIKSLAKI